MRIFKMTSLVLLMGLSTIGFANGKSDLTTNNGNPEAIHDGLSDTIVHLFEWRWDDIAKECETFLGPKGFKAVQVSPPQEHVIVEGRPWWERYQTVSYKIIGRSGDENQFREMISRCEAVGVSIYVDVILNHMAGLDLTPNNETLQGVAGSSFSRYNYPGLYGPNDFNRCGRNGHNEEIRNYQDRWEVQNCNLVTLSDLKTSFDYVRGKLASYLNKLMEMGIKGFRIDGAKHMPSEDIGAILARLNQPAFIYSEVIDLGGEPIKADEYYSHGRVTEFRYGGELARVIREGKMDWLTQFGDVWGMITGSKALVFVDNHDNQRGHGAAGRVLTYKDGASYALANVFMLAWPYGAPRLMSSYQIYSDRHGPPLADDGQTLKVHAEDGSLRCFDRWVCEHRWRAIANMVEFRKVASDELRVTNWWSNGNNQIAFGRGDRGFVVINNEGHHMAQTLQTSMEPGRYCNIVSADFDGEQNQCAGEVVVVDESGRLTVNISSKSSLAIHAEAKL